MNTSKLFILIIGFILLLSTATLQALENIAIGKPVTVSSSYSPDYPAKNTTDCNPNTLWGTKPNTTGSEWIYVDLGSEESFRGVRLTWYSEYYAKNVIIAVSHDSITWHTAYTTTNGTASPIELFADTAVTYRYVGFLFSNGTHGIYAITELEVLAEPILVDVAPEIPYKLIMASNFQSSSVDLDWTKAVDDITPIEDLEYKVVKSFEPNIDTVLNAEMHGIYVLDWTKNITTYRVNGLLSNTQHYINVIVRDEKNNKSVYTMKEFMTLP